ncbi:hypothetical protein OGAPHI_003963 [Ogataea philodendri]|uniref:Uncharacterized protein n=1 Tax=Ogataea philodendri TaxID=1378263 RepID=A0A9P8P5V4_9ASCO|nr:uncharacterized protein OGAPHI_003963 [Ogataea philodendri]KAH3665775.1 hypothetical protein OGAPHI_003963 [Ogataea philodendri]
MVANAAKTAEMAPDAPRDNPNEPVAAENRIEAKEAPTPLIRYKEVKFTTPRTWIIVDPNEYRQNMFMSKCVKFSWLNPDHKSDHCVVLDGPLSRRKYLLRTFIVLSPTVRARHSKNTPTFTPIKPKRSC